MTAFGPLGGLPLAGNPKTAAAVTGTLSISAGATLTGAGKVLVNGTLSTAAGAVLTGAGGPIVTGTLSTSAGATLTAAGTVASGVVGTLSIAAGATLTAAGNVTQPAVVGTLSIAAGATLSGAGNVLVAGTLSISAGAVLTGAGTVTQPPITGTLSISAGATLTATGAVGTSTTGFRVTKAGTETFVTRGATATLRVTKTGTEVFGTYGSGANLRITKMGTEVFVLVNKVAATVPQPTGFGRYRGIVGINAYGKALVGDAFAGIVGALDYGTFTEYGQQMTALVVSPPIAVDRKRIFLKRFELDVESGVGLNTGQGSEPIWSLDWSKDGGRTWSSLVVGKSMGEIGQYTKRLRWLRMGVSRQWLLRIRSTDPVRRVIVAAHVDATEGMG